MQLTLQRKRNASTRGDGGRDSGSRDLRAQAVQLLRVLCPLLCEGALFLRNCSGELLGARFRRSEQLPLSALLCTLQAALIVRRALASAAVCLMLAPLRCVLRSGSGMEQRQCHRKREIEREGEKERPNDRKKVSAAHGAVQLAQ